MKPRRDPFYSRRKEAMDSLRATVTAAVREAVSSGANLRVEVFIGKPGAMRTFSSATMTIMVHISVPRNWRASVHMDGIATIGNFVCLKAQRAGKPSGADGCWRVLLFDPTSGETGSWVAVKLAGVVRYGQTAAQAYEGCLRHFQAVLLGEE